MESLPLIIYLQVYRIRIEKAFELLYLNMLGFYYIILFSEESSLTFGTVMIKLQGTAIMACPLGITLEVETPT